MIVAHLSVDLPVQALWADVTFVKEPCGDEARLDRDTTAELWGAAATAYRDRRRRGLLDKPIQGWVYAHAPGLGYRGMMPYGIAGEEDPHQEGQVRRLEPGEVPE